MSRTKQAMTQTTLDEAIDRVLRKSARAEGTRDGDAHAIARLVVKHWGDDAPGVIEQALDLAREQVRGWAKKGGQKPPDPPGGEGRA